MKILLVLYCCVIAARAQDGLQVNTTEGLIEGTKATDGNYYAFYGIPYAGSTSGENRFKGPTQPSAYPGLFHAMDTDIICAQPSPRGLIGVENCLSLNIFTNNVTTPKPVIVWLNSEEYTTSNAPLYSFKNFVEQGIVSVSLNFRLSIFGFLCLGVPEAPGNAGLKDVIQGLKWIKENIGGFGGNPDNIVLIGHGSGAAIVDLITLSPQSQNLVHKAVALSGSGLAPWAVAYDPVGYANMFGAKLSYTDKSREDLAKLLQTTDITLLANALNEFKFTNNTPLFAPCIENAHLNNSVLTDAPINLLRSGNYSHVPYIASYVTREGTMRAQEAAFDDWLEQMQNNFTNFLPVDLKPGANTSAVAQSIREFYFSKTTISMETIEDYLDYQGDSLVLVSVIRNAKERGLTSKSDVRLMEFGCKGSMNSDWTYTQIPLTGVKHGGILNFLFGFDLREAEKDVMDSLVRRLTAFAYNGTPTVSNFTEWNPIKTNSIPYLRYTGNDGPIANLTYIFGEESRTDPHTTRMTFWNDLYSKYYVPPSPVSSSGKMSSFVSVITLCVMFVKLF